MKQAGFPRVRTCTGLLVFVTIAQAKQIARLRRKYGAELFVTYDMGGVKVSVFGRQLLHTGRKNQ